MKRFIIIILFFSYNMGAESIAQTKLDIDKLDNAAVVVQVFDYKGNQIGHGSGFIIDDKGTTVTNYHVVAGASSIKVKIDINGIKETYDADKIISGNSEIDLVKISIKNPYSKKFPFFTLSKVFPSKGEECLAIGTPADEKYMNTVSKGLISNVDQYSSPKLLQTNAEITHGSSGGPLINTKGEVIGVTSSGDMTEDGARASINFAIWIGELNNLSIINKPSLIAPASIPCQLGFYTNNPYTGDVYFYIDGIYIGRFTKYFQNNYAPTCGEEGTITRNLYSGTHSYRVYFASTDQSYYGTIKLTPGECKMFKVGPDESQSVDNTRAKDDKVESNNSYSDAVFSIIKNCNYMVGSGSLLLNFTTFFNEGKYGIQGFWTRGKTEDGETPSNYSVGEKRTIVKQKYGIDFRKIIRTPKIWTQFYFGPSLRFYRSKLTVDSTIYVGFPQYYSSGSREQKENQIFLNGRAGAEFNLLTWLAINVDFGVGYLFGKNYPGEFNFEDKSNLWLDGDIVIGIKF